MFKFFDFLVEIVDIVWNFISGSIIATLNLFSFLLSGVTSITNILAVLPPFSQGFLFMIVAVSIVSLILGHFIDW